MQTKTIIFDFDGTLVDSMKQWSNKMLKVLEKFKIDYPSNIIKIITPLGDKGTAQYFIKEFGINATVEELIEIMDGYAYNEYKNNILPKETVKDTLEYLKGRGYSLNVLTASPHKMLDVCLQRNGLYDIFDNVWSCDDFNTTKSNPEIYRLAAQKCGVEVEECVFLDDNINALSTAKNAGMPVIGVYDESSSDITEQIKQLCERFVYKFSELLEML